MTKRIGAIILILLMFAVCLSSCSAKKSNTIRIGTGGEGGNYFSYGSVLAGFIDEEGQYKAKVQMTNGSAANIRLLADGYVDMALVQADTYVDAISGKGAFSEGSVEGIHSVTGLFTEYCQIITAKDSDIKTPADLFGKTVAVGAENSGVTKNATDILSVYGLSFSDIKPVYLDFSASAEALEKGEIDAFFCTSALPTTAVVTLSENTDIRIVCVEKDYISRLMNINSSYTSCVIPENTYKGQTEKIYTTGVPCMLVASDTVTEEAESLVLSILKDNNEHMQDVSFGVVSDPEVKETPKMSFDMYTTLALAVAALGLGTFLRKKISFLDKFCVPAPVVGGLIFALVSCVLYVTGVVEFSFDETLKTVCMTIFFTSVGFQANLKVLKSGGVSLIIFLVVVVGLIFCQNGIAIGLSKILNIDPLIGLCTGSIPMVGGHGTSGAFGEVLQDLGLSSATTICTSAATFGLIFGSLMGGPLGRRLILGHDLMKTVVPEVSTALEEEKKKNIKSVSEYAPAAFLIVVAMGIGTIVSNLLSKTGMTFPAYIGAMIVAAVIRNVGEYSGKIKVPMGDINDLGGICLSLFLGVAMITLKLWQLADLALPLIALLLAQTIFMAVFAYIVVFNVMGRDYDAAVLASGTCGFGMGATPNAMANMQVLTQKYAPSVKAYILVPIVGSMFADFINSIVITFFINMVK